MIQNQAILIFLKKKDKNTLEKLTMPKCKHRGQEEKTGDKHWI